MRRLFTFAAALSLLLLCVRSYWTADTIFREVDDQPMDGVSSAKGGLLLFSRMEPSRPEGSRRSNWHIVHDSPYNGEEWTPGPPHYEWGFAGLWYQSGSQGGYWYRFLYVPFWMLAVIALVPQGWWYAAWRRRRRLEWRGRNHRCPRCGYDLRASPDRCPECGTPARSNAVPPKNPGIPN